MFFMGQVIISGGNLLDGRHKCCSSINSGKFLVQTLEDLASWLTLPTAHRKPTLLLSFPFV